MQILILILKFFVHVNILRRAERDKNSRAGQIQNQQVESAKTRREEFARRARREKIAQGHLLCSRFHYALRARILLAAFRRVPNSAARKERPI